MATTAQVKAFIELIAPSVILKCSEHSWGVPSAIIAQAGLESAWGTSGLWKKAYNLCGQKWVSPNTRSYVEMNTREQKTDGTYYTVLAKFVKYADVTDGIQGYFEFIEKYKRYKPVIEAKDYKTYANQLKACGWATSINYANNIITQVNKYNLTRYDNADVAIFDKTKYYSPNTTYKTLTDLYIRDGAAGNKIKYDGITANAKANSKFDDYGYAILKENSKVTCKEVIGLNTSVWMRIPSGYICAISGNKVYVSNV